MNPSPSPSPSASWEPSSVMAPLSSLNDAVMVQGWVLLAFAVIVCFGFGVVVVKAIW